MKHDVRLVDGQRVAEFTDWVGRRCSVIVNEEGVPADDRIVRFSVLPGYHATLDREQAGAAADLLRRFADTGSLAEPVGPTPVVFSGDSEVGRALLEITERHRVGSAVVAAGGTEVDRLQAIKHHPGTLYPHDYEPHDGTSDCRRKCGAWMGPSRSGSHPEGAVDPFGDCPKHPGLTTSEEASHGG